MMALDTDPLDDTFQDDIPKVPFNIRPEISAMCRAILTCTDTINFEFPYPINTEFIVTIGESDDDVGDVLENMVTKLTCNQSAKVEISKVEGKVLCKPVEELESKVELLSDEKDKEEANNKPTDIPNVIIATLTLIDISNKLPICFWSLEEKYQTALHHKTEGVRLFKEGAIDRAFRRFGLALKFLILMQPQKTLPATLKEKHIQLRVQCYSNLAACQLKQNGYNYVIDNCTKVLDLDSGNTKCLYRRAEAYFALKKFDQCRSDVKNGLTLEPNSKSFNDLWQKIRDTKDSTKEAN